MEDKWSRKHNGTVRQVITKYHKNTVGEGEGDGKRDGEGEGRRWQYNGKPNNPWVFAIFNYIWFRLPLSSTVWFSVCSREDWWSWHLFHSAVSKKGFLLLSLNSFVSRLHTPQWWSKVNKMSIYTVCTYRSISETPPSVPPSGGVFVSRLNSLLSGPTT